jgi:tetratricopeptide (TPR) repeat protein
MVMTLNACSSPEEKAAEYIESGNQLLAEQDYTRASLEYRNALQINQNLPDAWYGLAKIHERKQEWENVYSTLNRIRELAPEHVDGRIMLAQLLLASNELDQALTDTREIMELAPGDARAHALMAAVQFRLGNHAGAHEEVDRALSIDPDNNEALLVRARVLIAEEQYEQALGLLDKSIPANPDNVSLYLMKIQTLEKIGDKKAIEGVFLSLVERFPDNPGFKNALAMHYIAERDIDAAEKMFMQIIEANPDNVPEKLRFVDFKRQFRSTEDAIALLKTYMAASPSEYRYHFRLGEIYENLRQEPRAREVYQGIVATEELQQNGLEARNKLAALDLRANDRDKAAALVDEVLAEDRNNENALLMLAGLQIGERKFDDAIVSARTILRDNPNSSRALGLLAQAYDANGQTELATESYTNAFRLSPGTPVFAYRLARHLIAQRNYTQADEVLQQSVSQGNRGLDALKLLAQVKVSLGEWDVAERLARQLEKVEGQEALSQQILGVIYQGKEQQEESIGAFRRAHELAPQSAQPIVSLVQTYVRSGKPEEARRFLDSVLSVHEDNVIAHLLLGQLSLFEGKTAEAVEQFEKTIEINPQADIAYRTLTAIHIRDSDFDSAERIARQAVEALPDSNIPLVNLAFVYETKKDYAAAIELYESVLAKDPDTLVARNNLASLLTDYGGDQASLERARTISAQFRSSDIPQFRDTYAWASVVSGTNLEEAVVILEGIVKDNDQVGAYHYHLGEAYRKKGDVEKAKASLEKAVKLAPAGSDVVDKARESLQLLN